MGSWRNWRVPVAWLVVAAAVVGILRSVLAVSRAVNVSHVRWATEAASGDADLLAGALLVLLLLAGLACRVPETSRGSRAVAGVILALVVVAALADLARLVVVVGVRPSQVALGPVVAGLVARLLVELAIVVALAAAARTLAATVPGVRAELPSVPEPAAALIEPPAPVPTPAVWNPDPTAGTVWRRAGDAATGAAGVVSAGSEEGPRTAPDWRPARPSESPDEPH